MKRSLPLIVSAMCAVGACDRSTTNDAPSLPSSEPSAVASTIPSASADDAGTVRRPSAQIAGRVLEIKRGDAPSVRIAASQGDLTIKGIDGESLGWRRGDRVLVDGDKRDADTIDCSDAAACSLGLESGGDLVLSDVDAAAAARLLGAMKKRVVVAGPSRRASVELRATNDELLIRSFAAAMGLGFKRYRNLVLFAQPKQLAQTKIKRVLQKSRRTDIQLVHAELFGLTKFLADTLKTPIAGSAEGEITVSAYETDSADVLDAAFALCGVQFKKNRGTLELVSSGSACRQPRPEPRCPRRDPSAAPRAANDSLRCIPPERLRALGVVVPEPGKHIALLGEGDPVGDEIAPAEGDLLGQSEKIATGKGDYEVNWRVSHIARDHIELYFGVDPNAGINVKERRIRISVATSAPPEGD